MMRRTAMRSAAGRALGLFLALAAAGGAAGCAHATTKVEQGLLVTTGNATYDDFFRSVHDLGEEAQKGGTDLADARQKLAAALAAGSTGDADAAVAAVEQRAKALRDQGVLLHLELLPEAKVVAVKSKGTFDAGGETSVKAIEDFARSALALMARMGSMRERAAVLEKTRVDLLAQSASAFKGDAQIKHDELDQELTAAGGVLTKTSDVGASAAGGASSLLVRLMRAVETGAPPSAAALAEAKGKGKKPGTGAATGTGTGTGTAPKAAGTTPKQPKGGDDFEP
jgi:hypothetical protein